MTPGTAALLAENTEQLYVHFAQYRERLAKEPRAPDDQVVFDQLFGGNLRELAVDRLVSLVRIIRLPGHRSGALELKVLLPRLCEVALQPRQPIAFPQVVELLARFDFEQWPGPERTVVWDWCLLMFRILLEEFGGREMPPWGAYGYFRDLSQATKHVEPALLSWEMADFPTADLQLATFTKAWIEDRPLRDRQPWGREPTEAIERWLRTAGRLKLERAVKTHADAPFRSEFEAALAALA